MIATPETETLVSPTEPAAPMLEPRPRARRGLKRGLLLGLATGLIGGSLLAPRPGEELRRRVREEAEELLAHPGALPERLRERLAARERETEAGAAPAGPARRLRSLVDAARERVRDAIDQGRQASREAQERLREEYRRMTHRGA